MDLLRHATVQQGESIGKEMWEEGSTTKFLLSMHYGAS
jgi:hypothetical protein